MSLSAPRGGAIQVPRWLFNWWRWFERIRMPYHLDIPESIASSIPLPVTEIQPRLRVELALALYVQGILSLGKAAELAELTRFAFADLSGARNIPRHYTGQDLAQDLDYARGQ